MKRILITFGILACAISAIAQQGGIGAFITQENLLSAAIDNKSFTQQNQAINNLIPIMKQALIVSTGAARTTEQQVLQYVQLLPKNKLITDKKTVMDQLNKFKATY